MRKKILLVLFLLVAFIPINIYAENSTSDFETTITNELKDGSSNVDFKYNLNLKETFNILYNKDNYTINKYISDYITTKIGTGYNITIDTVDENTLTGTYTISKDSDSYSGTFSYSLTNNLE